MKNISRKEKELLYKVKMNKLQRIWGNINDGQYDFSDWTDEQLDNGLKYVKGQLRFEIFVILCKIIIVIILSFVIKFLFMKS